ncbi:MAG TPA: dTDP-4-dehydrorhamnose reductase [Alphaproteobacteria bacterium]|nr:dTDP-4-dehydrorhamnose reductase [Alphaproteobacteria bacterium]
MSAHRLLLLGANGQIGQALCAQPMPQDWQLGAYGHAELDIADHRAVQDAIDTFRPGFIINAAAFTAVDEAELDLPRATGINFEAVANLAAQSSARDIPLLHLSTDYVFDGNDGDAPYTPEHKMNPLNNYGHSKMMGEEALRHGHPFHVILRVSSVFGEFASNLLTKTLAMIDGEDELRVVTDQISCPTYAPAIAETILAIAVAILKGKHDGFGTFHYCGTPEATRFDFVSEVMKQYAPFTARRPRITPIKRADLAGVAARPPYSVLDCGKIRDVYGIKQKPWRASLGEAISILMGKRDKNT